MTYRIQVDYFEPPTSQSGYKYQVLIFLPKYKKYYFIIDVDHVIMKHRLYIEYFYGLIWVNDFLTSSGNDESNISAPMNMYLAKH